MFERLNLKRRGLIFLERYNNTCGRPSRIESPIASGTLFSVKKKKRENGEESHEHALGYTSFQGPLSDRSKRRPSRFHGPFATSCTVTCSRYALYSSYTSVTLLPEFSFHFTPFVLIPLRQRRLVS